MTTLQRIAHFFIAGILCLTFFASCQKDEIIHENLIIDDNTPPENNGISTLQLNNYINNLYIDLYGRAPTESELSTDGNYLKSNNYSEEARAEVINDMMTSFEYYKNINVLTSQKMLVDIDSMAIEYEIDLYEYFIYLNDLAGDTLYNFYYAYEIDKLTKLRNAHTDLYAGNIGINEYFRRYVYNTFYDEVNMGSLNFVVACFENLFHRLPTDEESSDGILMVDGGSSQIFLTDGSSKEDFIDILVNHIEFYQGLVLEAFSNLLARPPTSFEMATYGVQMMEDNHVNNVKRIILQSEEYAGF